MMLTLSFFLSHSEQNLSSLMLSLICSLGQANNKLLFSKRTHYFSLELTKNPILKYNSNVSSSTAFSKAFGGLQPIVVSNEFAVGCQFSGLRAALAAVIEALLTAELVYA